MSLSSGGGNKKRGAGERQIPPGSTSSKLRETGQLFFRVKEPVIVKEETAGRIDTALLNPFCTSNLIKEREGERESAGSLLCVLYNATEARGPGGDNGRLPGKGHALSASAL